MIKAFCVAGHTFHLDMADTFPMWPLLTQYDPFVTEPVDDPLFTVEVVDSLPELELTPLFVNEPEDEGQPRLDLYTSSEGIVVEMAPVSTAPVCSRLLASTDYRYGRLLITRRNKSSALFSINNSLMLLYAFCSAPYMTLEMHSSVIGNSGRGYMFLGKSGTGKSTHSSLWLKHIEGSELMNDDNPVIRVGDDGVVRVYGTPWSGKTPCYRNVVAPVGAIVRIRQAKHNTITPQSILEAYASIYSSCSGFKADSAMADGLHRTMEHIVMNVPCYTLDCLPDGDAARVCASEVMKGHEGQ